MVRFVDEDAAREEGDGGGAFARLLEGVLGGLDRAGGGSSSGGVSSGPQQEEEEEEEEEEGLGKEGGQHAVGGGRHFVMWAVDDLLCFDAVDVAAALGVLASGGCVRGRSYYGVFGWVLPPCSAVLVVWVRGQSVFMLTSLDGFL